MHTKDSILSIPHGIAQIILKGDGITACPLLSTDKLIKFCKNRGLQINKERLLRLERLGIFSPVFRVQTPDDDEAQLLTLPLISEDQWFEKGWAWDTTAVPINYKVPEPHDKENEAYYSQFQILCLDKIIKSMTASVQLDSVLEQKKDLDWNEYVKKCLPFAQASQKSQMNCEFSKSIALLCQLISDRYYPQTQSDQRTIQVPQGNGSIDPWVHNTGYQWDWGTYCYDWHPEKVERIFRLTPEILKQAYFSLSSTQAMADPLANWYQLVQFVDVRERQHLKGSALFAETLRSGALMLRLLYRDLYKVDLPHPNEMMGKVINHVPELHARDDSRQHLELVANRFHLNPQPKLVLFVEGQSEEVAIREIFDQYFGAHPGKYAIEIVCLWGVPNATGSKEDRYRAILRLIDYLHHRQTFTFLILDNEGYAKKLKNAARRANSTMNQMRFITRPEYIKIWKSAFEFDNYSSSEIAAALTKTGNGRAKFSVSEVKNCTATKNPGAELSKLYKNKSGCGLNKPQLNKVLIDEAFSPNARRKLENRPIVKTLIRVTELAIRNQLPTLHAVWETNQSSRLLGKKKKK